MDTQDKAVRLLEEFARSRGIEGLVFREDGDCALVDEEERVTHIQRDTENDRLICLAALGDLPPPDQCDPELLHALLAANFCWGGSLEATLAIEAQSGQVILQRSLPLADADADMFGRFVDAFIQTVLYWEEHLAELRLSSGADFPFDGDEDGSGVETMLKI